MKIELNLTEEEVFQLDNFFKYSVEQNTSLMQNTNNGIEKVLAEENELIEKVISQLENISFKETLNGKN